MKGDSCEYMSCGSSDEDGDRLEACPTMVPSSRRVNAAEGRGRNSEAGSRDDGDRLEAFPTDFCR